MTDSSNTSNPSVVLSQALFKLRQNLGKGTSNNDGPLPLTTLEYEILALKILGKSERVIAETLTKLKNKAYSMGIVSFIIRNHLYPKLGAKSDNELIDIALLTDILSSAPNTTIFA